MDCVLDKTTEVDDIGRAQVAPAEAAAACMASALAWHQHNDLARARDGYEQVLALVPDHIEALNLLGLLALQTRDFSSAASHLGRARALAPGQRAIYRLLGRAQLELKDYEAALASYDQALQLGLDTAEVWHQHGLVLMELARYESAAVSFEQAIARDPGLASSHFQLGNALAFLSQGWSAVWCYDKAIELDPNHARAYYNRAHELAALGRLRWCRRHERAVTEAELSANEVSERKLTDDPLALHRAAVTDFERAIALQRDFFEAHYNLGRVLMDLHRFDDAVASLETAIALQPKDLACRQNLAFCLLRMGLFEGGWREHEWRLADPTAPQRAATLTKPQWQGDQSLLGKTIFLYAEQGLGDTLHFVRFVPEVLALGARVLLEVPSVLRDLLAHSLPGVDLVVPGVPPPSFDYHASLMSLPAAFRTAVDTIPHSLGYLTPVPEKLAQWRHRLGPATGLRVGLVWSGNPLQSNNQFRSVDVQQLLKALPRGVQYVSLQKEVRRADQSTLQGTPGFMHLGNELSDFSDTAALCALLDVVVTVDTSVAHLAGALGKPVWTMLSYNSDWRWHLDRSDSPWYASARLFRQDSSFCWDKVFAEVAHALGTLASQSADCTTPLSIEHSPS